MSDRKLKGREDKYAVKEDPKESARGLVKEEKGGKSKRVIDDDEDAPKKDETCFCWSLCCIKSCTEKACADGSCCMQNNDVQSNTLTDCCLDDSCCGINGSCACKTKCRDGCCRRCWGYKVCTRSFFK